MAVPSTDQIKGELEMFDIAYGDDTVLDKSKCTNFLITTTSEDLTKLVYCGS